MLDLEHIRRFYLGREEHGETRFETWERGHARGDSVTPSTYSAEYRRWMGDLLLGLLHENPGGVISIGSGNAAIEADLAGAGHRVLAVDVIEEAVALARRKGVEAVLADVRQWTPPDGGWTVVLADGVMGHLYQPQTGLRPVLTAVRSWLAPRRGTLVVSNDRPPGLANVQPAPGVPGFHWLSEDFLYKEAEAAGFDQLTSTTFTYHRPVSGTRDRAVLTGRA